MVIRKISLADEEISVFAGTAGSSSSSPVGDGGPATSAQFSSGLLSVRGDSGGNLYVADSTAARVRKIDSSGIITTFAGTGTSAYTSTTGVATSTTLNAPSAVWIDSAGVVFISKCLCCVILF